MVPNDARHQWEAAYLKYRKAYLLTARSPTDPNVARVFAATSRDVATAWRALADNLPWWAAAAVRTAAEALDHQADEWSRRADPPRIPTTPVVAAPTPFRPGFPGALTAAASDVLDSAAAAPPPFAPPPASGAADPAVSQARVAPAGSAPLESATVPIGSVAQVPSAAPIGSTPEDPTGPVPTPYPRRRRLSA